MTPAGRPPVQHFDRIDSTNAEARRLAQGGEAGPLWLVADEQTAGRGRLGRSWVSAPGNLYATLLLPLNAGPAIAGQLSFVAALAVHDTVAAFLPRTDVRIKWPNDVLARGAKICGLLAEVVAGDPTRVALGCGFNVAHAPQGTPYPVTSLTGEGAPVPVAAVFQHLAQHMAERLAQWGEGRGFGAIRSDWADRALGLGGPVEVATGGKTLEGRFHALGEDGALILETADGQRHSIHAGDVRFAELDRLRALHA